MEAQANYLLALKGNQADLYEEVQETFNYGRMEAQDEQWEYDHGRYGTRRCEVMTATGYLNPKFTQRWSSVRRTIGGVTTTQTRYYLTGSADFSAGKLNELTPGPWSIENKLHWHLDVTFQEDGSRARNGHAGVDLSILRKIATQAVKHLI